MCLRLLTAPIVLSRIAATMLGLAPSSAGAQGSPDLRRDPTGAVVVPRRFASRTDSLEWVAAKAMADSARAFRLVISLSDRRLWAIVGQDTVVDVPVAVGRDSAFEYQGKRWLFRTRRGRHTVARKDSVPLWIPPEWHYYEVARERGLLVRRLVRNQPIPLEDGGRLEIRSGIIGVAGLDSLFSPLPTGEEIIFDGILFIPPIGTKQREIEGELGRYRLDLGNGYMLHGTPHQESIGEAATHGCMRLRDDDIAWLYEIVPVGTPVYVY